MKVYPIPPEQPNSAWALPYSVRSFISQASDKFGGCYYSCTQRGTIYDEAIFSDRCQGPAESEDDYDRESWNCHALAGWSAGKASCPLWVSIAALCQTDAEKRFLHTYLRYVKDRQFPMLLPQVRVGIAERRRSDFIAYVPLQYWKFKWVVVELDGAHPEEKQSDDERRDQYYEEHRYEVISLRPGSLGYLEEVKRLVEKIDIWMGLAESDAWDAAVEAQVVKFEPPPSDDEIPF